VKPVIDRGPNGNLGKSNRGKEILRWRQNGLADCVMNLPLRDKSDHALMAGGAGVRMEPTVERG